jgi:hypothetical protein
VALPLFPLVGHEHSDSSSATQPVDAAVVKSWWIRPRGAEACHIGHRGRGDERLESPNPVLCLYGVAKVSCGHTGKAACLVHGHDLELV